MSSIAALRGCAVTSVYVCCAVSRWRGGRGEDAAKGLLELMVIAGYPLVLV